MAIELYLLFNLARGDGFICYSVALIFASKQAQADA